MSVATAARTASSWRSRWRRRSRRAASPRLPAAVPENPTLPDSMPTQARDRRGWSGYADRSGGRVPQEPAGRPCDGGGIDAVVTVEVPTSAGLAEIVDAERDLRHAKSRTEEGQGVGVAVQDRHEGHVLLVGADEPKEMGIGLAQAPVQPVSAGDREDAGEDAVLVKLARGRDGIGHHYARGEDVHRVVLSLAACPGPRLHEPVAAPQHVGAVIGTGGWRQALIERPGRKPQIQAGALAAGDLPEAGDQDAFDLASEHRLVVGDAGQR